MKCPAQTRRVRTVSNGAIMVRRTSHDRLVTTGPGSVTKLPSRNPSTIFNRFVPEARLRATSCTCELSATCRTHRVHPGEKQRTQVCAEPPGWGPAVHGRRGFGAGTGEAPGSPREVAQDTNFRSELGAHYRPSQDAGNTKTPDSRARDCHGANDPRPWVLPGSPALRPRLSVSVGQLVPEPLGLAAGRRPESPTQKQALGTHLHSPSLCICLDVLHSFEACICLQTMSNNFQPV